MKHHRTATTVEPLKISHTAGDNLYKILNTDIRLKKRGYSVSRLVTHGYTIVSLIAKPKKQDKLNYLRD